MSILCRGKAPFLCNNLLYCSCKGSVLSLSPAGGWCVGREGVAIHIHHAPPRRAPVTTQDTEPPTAVVVALRSLHSQQTGRRQHSIASASLSPPHVAVAGRERARTLMPTHSKPRGAFAGQEHVHVGAFLHLLAATHGTTMGGNAGMPPLPHRHTTMPHAHAWHSLGENTGALTSHLKSAEPPRCAPPPVPGFAAALSTARCPVAGLR